MKGGNSFNISDATYGSLLLALNDMNYYIKLEYEPTPGAKKETYFFVFNLSKNNNIINSFGLTNKLITNANIKSRISKTWLELDVEGTAFIKRINGFAYKVDPGMKDYNFDGSNGIPSKLTICMLGNAENNNEHPGYNLNLGDKVDEHFMSGYNTLGDTPDTKYVDIIKTMTILINEKKKFDAGNKSVKDTNTLLKLENDFFKSITYNAVNALNDIPVEDLMEFVSKNQNFISNDTPEFNRAIGALSAVYRSRFPDERKDIQQELKEANKQKLQRINDLPKQSADKKVGLVPNLDNIKSNTSISTTKPSTFNPMMMIYVKSIIDSLPPMLPESTKMQIKGAFQKWGGRMIQDPNDPAAKWYREQIKADIINTIKNAPSNLITDEELNNIIFSKRNRSFMEGGDGASLADRVRETIGARAAAGFIANAKAILTPTLDYPDKLSEYGESIIYITPPKDSIMRSKIVIFSEMGTDKIPIFGYLTIGKQMLLKVLEVQTNLNSPFDAPQSTGQKLKNAFTNLATYHPVMVASIVGVIANALGVALAESGIYGIKDIPTIKEIITGTFKTMLGDGIVTSFILSPLYLVMNDADRTKAWFTKAMPGAAKEGGKRRTRRRTKTKRYSKTKRTHFNA